MSRLELGDLHLRSFSSGLVHRSVILFSGILNRVFFRKMRIRERKLFMSPKSTRVNDHPFLRWWTLFPGADKTLVCCKDARITQLKNHNFRDKQFESLWFCMDVALKCPNILIFLFISTNSHSSLELPSFCVTTLDANSFLDRDLLNIMWLIPSKKCSARVMHIISSSNS